MAVIVLEHETGENDGVSDWRISTKTKPPNVITCLVVEVSEQAILLKPKTPPTHHTQKHYFPDKPQVVVYYFFFPNLKQNSEKGHVLIIAPLVSGAGSVDDVLTIVGSIWSFP